MTHFLAKLYVPGARARVASAHSMPHPKDLLGPSPNHRSPQAHLKSHCDYTDIENMTPWALGSGRKDGIQLMPAGKQNISGELPSTGNRLLGYLAGLKAETFGFG